MDIQGMRDAVNKLDQLLRDPEPGLMAWHEAVRFCLRGLDKAYASPPPKVA